MKINHKKRLFLAAGSVATVGAVAALLVGATYGLFSATSTTQTNHFTAGTVSLTQTASTTCTISTMVPGDKSSGYTTSTSHRTDTTDSPCTFTVKYTGSVDAYLGLDVSVAGTAGSATPHATGLFTPEGATGLKLQVKSGSTGFTLTGLTSATSSVSNLLITAAPVATNATETFTVNFALPRGASNKFLGAKTTLTLKVEAAQSSNNAPSSVCATAGKACTNINWS